MNGRPALGTYNTITSIGVKHVESSATPNDVASLGVEGGHTSVAPRAPEEGVTTEAPRDAIPAGLTTYAIISVTTAKSIVPVSP